MDWLIGIIGGIMYEGGGGGGWILKSLSNHITEMFKTSLAYLRNYGIFKKNYKGIFIKSKLLKPLSNHITDMFKTSLTYYITNYGNLYQMLHCHIQQFFFI